MDNYTPEKTSAIRHIEKKKKKKDGNEACASLPGTFINVLMSVMISPPPTHLIFSLSFHVPLRKEGMVLLRIKPKIMLLVAVDGNHKFTIVLLLQIGVLRYIFLLL